METPPLFHLPITITGSKEKPEIGLRKKIKNKDLIKILCSAAHRETPIVIQPIFTDKLQSISQMQNKGIIKFNSEEDLYYFLI